jgi:hypothetical protein
MYKRIRVSQETQHNQRPDQTNIIQDQIAQQEQVGSRDSYNPTKARTSLQLATSRNSDFPNPRAGNQEIPSSLFSFPFTEEKGGGSLDFSLAPKRWDGIDSFPNGQHGCWGGCDAMRKKRRARPCIYRATIGSGSRRGGGGGTRSTSTGPLGPRIRHGSGHGRCGPRSRRRSSALFLPVSVACHRAPPGG